MGSSDKHILVTQGRLCRLPLILHFKIPITALKKKIYVKKPPAGGFSIQDGVLTTRLIDSSALGCKQYIMSVLLLYTFVKVDAKNND